MLFDRAIRDNLENSADEIFGLYHLDEYPESGIERVDGGRAAFRIFLSSLGILRSVSPPLTRPTDTRDVINTVPTVRFPGKLSQGNRAPIPQT